MFAGLNRSPGFLLNMRFHATFCIDAGKHFLDHYPVLHPCQNLREATAALRAMSQENFLACVSRAMEIHTKSSTSPRAPKLSRGDWKQFATATLKFATEEREDLIVAAEAAIVLATGRLGDPIRKVHTRTHTHTHTHTLSLSLYPSIYLQSLSCRCCLSVFVCACLFDCLCPPLSPK